MATFVEDNRLYVKLGVKLHGKEYPDAVLLFVKGGYSNEYDLDGKRVSDWRLVYLFQNPRAATFFAKSLPFSSEVTGGSMVAAKVPKSDRKPMERYFVIMRKHLNAIDKMVEIPDFTIDLDAIAEKMRYDIKRGVRKLSDSSHDYLFNNLMRPLAEAMRKSGKFGKRLDPSDVASGIMRTFYFSNDMLRNKNFPLRCEEERIFANYAEGLEEIYTRLELPNNGSDLSNYCTHPLVLKIFRDMITDAIELGKAQFLLYINHFLASVDEHILQSNFSDLAVEILERANIDPIPDDLAVESALQAVYQEFKERGEEFDPAKDEHFEVFVIALMDATRKRIETQISLGSDLRGIAYALSVADLAKKMLAALRNGSVSELMEEAGISRSDLSDLLERIVEDPGSFDVKMKIRSMVKDGIKNFDWAVDLANVPPSLGGPSNEIRIDLRQKPLDGYSGKKRNEIYMSNVKMFVAILNGLGSASVAFRYADDLWRARFESLVPEYKRFRAADLLDPKNSNFKIDLSAELMDDFLDHGKHGSDMVEEAKRYIGAILTSDAIGYVRAINPYMGERLEDVKREYIDTMHDVVNRAYEKVFHDREPEPAGPAEKLLEVPNGNGMVKRVIAAIKKR